MAAKLRLIVDKGATFSRTFEYRENDGTTPISGLDDYEVRFQVRRTADDEDVVLDKEPTWDAVDASFSLVLTAAETGAIAAGSYVYAIELHAPGGEPVLRLIEGRFDVTPEVVR